MTMEPRRPAPPTGPSKPIEYRQICAIAREQFLAAPSMDDGEWTERIKDRLVQFGFAYPRPDQIAAAMSSVAHALSKTIGPRPVRSVPLPEASKAAAPEADRPPTPAEWGRMGRIVRRILAQSRPEPAEVATPAARETLTISEDELLNRFYREAQEDRLRALRMFAELAILREAGWDPAEIRRDFEAHRRGSLHGHQCFGCLSGERAMAWHHVIQIQHGGSNHPRNQVPLCRPCHAAVHPWLPKADRVSMSGWKQLGDVAEGVYEEFIYRKDPA